MTFPKPAIAHPLTSQWLSFENAGRILVYSGRVELGQGIKAALVRMAAGELGLDENQIELVSGDTTVVPNEGPTVGSLSVQVGGMAVRYAASAARWECLTRAGDLLQANPDDLAVKDGAILKDGHETGLTYWTLTADKPLVGSIETFARPIGYQGHDAQKSDFRRNDMLGRLTGQVFIHDLSFPDMLHGRIIHPPHKTTGLLTAEEKIAELASSSAQLFRNGQIVGVTSDDEHVVTRAAERLRAALEWQVPNLSDPETALHPVEKPVPVIEEGKLPDAPPDATVHLTRPCIAHASIGACCGVALFTSGKLEVWSHSQNVFGLRASLASVLGLGAEDILVRHTPGAGCYGHNGADDVALDAALLAIDRPGRHVRVIWARSDEFQTGPLSPAMRTEVRAWLSDEGQQLSIDVSVMSPGHSSRPGGENAPNLRAAEFLSEPIAVQPAKDAPMEIGGGAERNSIPLYETVAVRSTKHTTFDIPYRSSALRGLGAPINVAAIEGVMDELALGSGRDPFDFRLDHLKDVRAKAVIEHLRQMSEGTSAVSGDARGIAFARYKNTSGYFACSIEVSIDEVIRPIRVQAVADIGEVIDRSGAKNQLEGGILQALSCCMFEVVEFEDGRISTQSWEDYPILGFRDLPEIQIDILERNDEPPLGCGEIAAGPTIAAFVNAAAQGLGVRPQRLPLTRQNLLSLLNQ